MYILYILIWVGVCVFGKALLLMDLKATSSNVPKIILI